MMKKYIYQIQKKGIYEFAHINDSVYGCKKDCVVTANEENPKLVTQRDEMDKIVSFFYHIYKGEGERKIKPRIKRFYTDISIKQIQKWLNSNKINFKISKFQN